MYDNARFTRVKSSKKKWNIETLSKPNLLNKWAFRTKC